MSELKFVSRTQYDVALSEKNFFLALFLFLIVVVAFLGFVALKLMKLFVFFPFGVSFGVALFFFLQYRRNRKICQLYWEQQALEEVQEKF